MFGRPPFVSGPPAGEDQSSSRIPPRPPPAREARVLAASDEDVERQFLPGGAVLPAKLGARAHSVSSS
jgi:hypothetical protein